MTWTGQYIPLNSLCLVHYEKGFVRTSFMGAKTLLTTARGIFEEDEKK